ncbi:MAG: metallophosphoesterase [Bacteroidia bacterium]|nr:metallophosphoesterase [Bacteroidia bacterium]
MKKNTLLITLLFLFSSAFGQSIESLRITHGPWLQNLTTDGVTICWTTNLPAVPGVWMVRSKPQADSLIRNSTDGLINAGGTLHKVRISGLQSGIKYAYRVHSVELMKLRPYQIYFGDTVKGKEYSFTTQDITKKNTRFMVVNDIHTNGAKLAGFLKSGNAAEQDLLVYNGDIVDNFETEMQLLGPIIDTSVRYFASNVPFVFIRGNHETRGIMSRKLKDYLDFPDNRYYYSFDQGPVHFVILDCGEDKPDDNRYYYGLADYDNYRLQELEWLKDHVKTPAYRDAAFRVIIIHMPIRGGENAGYGPQFLFDHFGPVIREAGADLMIAAHTHRHLWQDPSLSGFGFPVLINGSTNYVKVEATPKTLSVRVVSDKDETILSEELQKR